MNRTLAYAKVYGHQKAIPEAENLKLTDSNYYYGLLGHLYADTNIENAISNYEQAIRLTKSRSEKETLKKEIEKLNKKRQVIMPNALFS